MKTLFFLFSSSFGFFRCGADTFARGGREGENFSDKGNFGRSFALVGHFGFITASRLSKYPRSISRDPKKGPGIVFLPPLVSIRALAWRIPFSVHFSTLCTSFPSIFGHGVNFFRKIQRSFFAALGAWKKLKQEIIGKGKKENFVRQKRIMMSETFFLLRIAQRP